MTKLKAAALAAAMIVLLVLTSQAAQARSQAPGKVVVIVADRPAIAEAEGGADLVKSLVGLGEVLQDGQRFFFIGMDEPTLALGPAVAGEPRFRDFQDQIDARLVSADLQEGPFILSALAETYNLLGLQRAAFGSTVYLVTGGSPETDLNSVADRLTPITAMFRDSGWSIIGLTLPGASPEVPEFSDAISTASGGESFELSAPGGLKLVADNILREEARGSLARLGEEDLSGDSVLTSTLSIAPGTHEATLLFFKEGRHGSLRLSNPDGFEASAGDRASSSVVETPHLVAWKLIDPTPGQWTVSVRGIDGAVSAWHYAVNKYGLVLAPTAVVPLNDPSTLTAYVTDGGEKVAVDGVEVVARITTPTGATLVHELKDDGLLGDAVAGDGYFSTTLPPITAEGSYQVQLELSWPEIEHRISSQASFSAQAFPALQVTTIQTANLEPGRRSQVAAVLVHVEGQPYAVPTDQITSVLAANLQDAGTLEIMPRELLDERRAWMYDVFFTPAEAGLQTLVLRLGLEYAGRTYSYSADSLVLSSVAPPVSPPAPVVEAGPPPVAAVPLPPVPVPAAPVPPPQIQATQTAFPWVALIIPLLVVAGVAAWAIYWRTRPDPRGYLYDDHDELVADFSSLQRHPIMRMLFKSRVRGEELGVAGFEGVSFTFFGRNIGLRSRRTTPTVRVNNQPILGQATIGDRTWIGTHGKLYSFWLRPLGPQGEPGLADD